jgi:hypothetical protein
MPGGFQMIRVLSIGNSFSQDAQAYLRDLAESAELEVRVVNLFIGGCSLKTHWENVWGDAAAYTYELNGDTGGGRRVSIGEALGETAWDVVTLQQASGDSGLLQTYFPWGELLSGYVKSCLPGARRLIHETWAYEIDSAHGHFPRYDRNQVLMYRALRGAYGEAARRLGLGIIPTGDLIQALRGKAPFDYGRGGRSLCRDGFHLSYTYGRYAAAALWCRFLGGDLHRSRFLPPGKDVDPALLALIRETVYEVLGPGLG